MARIPRRSARTRRAWRPLDLILLVVVAVIATLAIRLTGHPGGGDAPAGSAPTRPAERPSAPADPTPRPGGPSRTGEAASALPASSPPSGTGSTTVLDVPGRDSTRTGRTVRYTVEIEGGLGIPPQPFADQVRAVLTDARGWEVRDGVHFVNVSPAQRAAGASTDVRIILGSPAYVDRHCLPLRTGGTLSCHARGRVLLNANRFLNGADTYGADVANYRIYQISHEVGHSIGHGHDPCPGPGRLAPVMVQQTKSLYGCRPWPWPVRPH